jgi:toxin ParE1/3/4
MSLIIRRSDWFIGDLEHYTAWYQSEASWEVAERYLSAVSVTLARLSDMPGLGSPGRFSAPALSNVRYFPVERPFDKHIIFYRHDEEMLYAERIIHGARDLPRRLTQPPTAEGP